MRSLCYAISWRVRDGRPLLTGPVAEDFRCILAEIARSNGFAVEQAHVAPNEVRLLVSATSTHQVATLVKALKGLSARHLFKNHPELAPYRPHLWEPSYRAATVGSPLADAEAPKMLEVV